MSQPPTDAADRVWAENWQRQADTDWHHPNRLWCSLSLTERYHPNAYDWLVHNDHRAAQLARTFGHSPDPQPPPTHEQIATIEELTRQVVAELRAADERATEALRQKFEELGVKKLGPRYLTPEQLDQLNPLPNGRKRSAS